MPSDVLQILPEIKSRGPARTILRIAFYLVLTLGLLSLDVFAALPADTQTMGEENQTASEEKQPAGKVRLKPSLCIVKRGEKNCRIDLDVRWTASRPDEYCVYKMAQPDPLQCWENQSDGQHTDALQVTASENYRLVWLSDAAKVEIGQAVLQVVNVVPDDRRKQRRRRHVWSVF